MYVSQRLQPRGKRTESIPTPELSCRKVRDIVNAVFTGISQRMSLFTPLGTAHTQNLDSSLWHSASPKYYIISLILTFFLTALLDPSLNLYMARKRLAGGARILANDSVKTGLTVSYRFR